MTNDRRGQIDYLYVLCVGGWVSVLWVVGVRDATPWSITYSTVAAARRGVNVA